MRFPELKKLAKQYPKLEEHILRFDDYLAEVQRRRPEHQVVVQAQVAQALKIDEGIALVLLRFADKAGILQHWYYVYCDESEFFLGRFKTLESIPDRVFCPVHSELHDDEKYYYELTFTFRQGASSGTQQASMSHWGAAVYSI